VDDIHLHQVVRRLELLEVLLLEPSELGLHARDELLLLLLVNLSLVLDDTREFVPLHLVHGVVTLEELPHLSHAAQDLRGLGHHDPLRHEASEVQALDEGDFAPGIVVDGLEAVDARCLGTHDLEVGAVVDLCLGGGRLEDDDEVGSCRVDETDVPCEELPAECTRVSGSASSEGEKGRAYLFVSGKGVLVTRAHSRSCFECSFEIKRAESPSSPEILIFSLPHTRNW
jgi:hypothetical protein